MTTSDIDFFGEDPISAAARIDRLAADLRRLAVSPPSELDLQNAPVIMDAEVVVRSVFALSGPVFGHPSIRNGRSCLTSELFALDRQGMWARTGSRFYRLERSKDRENAK
jgi:hypothetical protein